MSLSKEDKKEIQSIILEEIENILKYDDPFLEPIEEGTKFEIFRVKLANRIWERRRELDIEKIL